MHVIVKKLRKQEVANRDGNSQCCLNVPIQVKLLDLCAYNLRFLFRLFFLTRRNRNL